MNWVNPKDRLPKEGEIVGVLYGHWKEHKPMSYEIMFGQVEYDNSGTRCQAQSWDMTGKGSWAVSIAHPEDDDYQPDDQAIAWIPAVEFILPAWVPHDEHWTKGGWPCPFSTQKGVKDGD